MFRAMDLSDVQVISPSRNRIHKIYYPRDNRNHNNYRKINGRTFLDMEIVDYPEFGTYFCPLENNETENKRYFIRFSKYNKYFPNDSHNIKISYEIKKGNDELQKSPYFLIYIFFDKSQEWLRFNIDVDSISRICLGENNNNEVRKNPLKKREQTIYFYLKYPPKIGHKKPEDNPEENISNIEEEQKKELGEITTKRKKNYAKSQNKERNKLKLKKNIEKVNLNITKRSQSFKKDNSIIAEKLESISKMNNNIKPIINHDKEFFFNRFRKELKNYEFKNHNHYINESSSSSIISSESEKEKEKY